MTDFCLLKSLTMNHLERRKLKLRKEKTNKHREESGFDDDGKKAKLFGETVLTWLQANTKAINVFGGL